MIWSLYHILELREIFSVSIDFTRLQSELLTALLINTQILLNKHALSLRTHFAQIGTKCHVSLRITTPLFLCYPKYSSQSYHLVHYGRLVLNSNELFKTWESGKNMCWAAGRCNQVGGGWTVWENQKCRRTFSRKT